MYEGITERMSCVGNWPGFFMWNMTYSQSKKIAYRDETTYFQKFSLAVGHNIVSFKGAIRSTVVVGSVLIIQICSFAELLFAKKLRVCLHARITNIALLKISFVMDMPNVRMNQECTN